MMVSITLGTNQKRIHFGNWKEQTSDYSIIKVIYKPDLERRKTMVSITVETNRNKSDFDNWKTR